MLLRTQSNCGARASYRRPRRSRTGGDVRWAGTVVRGLTLLAVVVAAGGAPWFTQTRLAAADDSGAGDRLTVVCDATAAPCAAPVADGVRASGRSQRVNPGADGQCTWGAAQRWFDATGSYPSLTGNAMSWGDSARAAGWTVVDHPESRSIVVFQPGVAGAGGIGHVAWVESVTQRADGAYLHVTEMNNSYLGGVGVFNGRDVKHVPGMTYVLAS